MTVAALTPSKEYVENGATVAFAAPFRFKAATDLVVTRFFADGTESVLTYGTDYAVTGGETDAGGTVTVTTAAASGTRLRIERRTARAQATQYPTNDTFPAASHEAALDRAMLIDQEQDDKIDRIRDRAVLVPDGDAATGEMVLPTVLQRALRVAGYGADGTPSVGPLMSALVSLIALSTTPALAQIADNIVYTASYAGAEARSLTAKLSEDVRSVKDYGAVGDDVTDDTLALQKALDDADHNTVILLPNSGSKRYRITAGLLWPTKVGVTLWSPGRKGARIVLDGGTPTTDIISRRDTSTDASNNINDSAIIGIGFEATGASRHGINLMNMSRSIVENCEFDNLDGAAVRAVNSLVCKFHGNRVNVCGEGILNDGGTWTGLNGWSIAGNYIGACTRRGMDFAFGMTGTAIHGNVVEGCLVAGIRFQQDMHGIDIRGCYFEENRSPSVDGLSDLANSSDIEIAQASFCSTIIIEGNYFNGSSVASDFYYPVRMGYAENCRIRNNFLNTGNKWILFETPNNSNNEIGQVKFLNGSYRASYLSQPTLNFAAGVLKGFVAAGNRITHDFSPAAQPRYPINLIPGADLTTGWTPGVTGSSTYTSSSNGARTSYKLTRSAGVASITKTITVGERVNSDLKERFVTFAVDVYVDNAAAKQLTIAIEDIVSGSPVTTASRSVSFSKADRHQLLAITGTYENPEGVRITITADNDADFYLTNERWYVSADPQAIR